jgi:hypothetical protein
MNHFKKTILPILLAGIWINVSVTIRWIFLVKSHMIEYYQNFNLVFPNEPINGVIWVIWGFLVAVFIFIISRKFNLVQTIIISWFLVFVMQWIVLWNIAMFPIKTLWIVIPLSLVEVFIGALICKRISPV